MKPYRIAEPIDVSIAFKRPDAASQAQLYDRNRRPFRFADAYTREGILDQLEDLFN